MTTAILKAMQWQVAFCRSIQASFSAAVVEAVLADLQAGGASASLFDAWTEASEETLIREAVPLRVLGALHLLVLKGEEPALAAAYPNDAGPGDTEAAARLIPEVVRRRAGDLAAGMNSPPQTNEVLRSAALLGGFLTVAEETGLPLRCLELGSSAGLNQSWDAYGYRLGAGVVRGDLGSPLVLQTDWRGPPPPDPPWPVVVERRGCDQAPIDIADPAQALRLQSFVWADQRSRLPRLQAAIDLALARGVTVERADAAAWAEANLHPAPGTATVLFHSIVRQYLSDAARGRLDRAIAAAAAAPTAQQPFAWLRMEGLPDAGFEVRLTLWPDGRERRLATVHPHGEWVAWEGGAECAGAAPA